MTLLRPGLSRFLCAMSPLLGWAPGIALTACSSDGSGPTNLLAALGPCDGLSIYGDPRCACCANFDDSARAAAGNGAGAVEIPICRPGLGLFDITTTFTSACAPANVADACGARCPENSGCLLGLCKPCAQPGERCEDQACCCPGESEARACDSVCDCTVQEGPDMSVSGVGGFAGAGGSSGFGGAAPQGGSSGAGATSGGGSQCVTPPECSPGRSFCECIPGNPPRCDDGRCVQFNDSSALCIESCFGPEDDSRCALAATEVACGTGTCGLDFGVEGGKGCSVFCQDSAECPTNQACRLVAGAGQKLCLP